MSISIISSQEIAIKKALQKAPIVGDVDVRTERTNHTVTVRVDFALDTESVVQTLNMPLEGLQKRLETAPYEQQYDSYVRGLLKSTMNGLSSWDCEVVDDVIINHLVYIYN